MHGDKIDLAGYQGVQAAVQVALHVWVDVTNIRKQC